MAASDSTAHLMLPVLYRRLVQRMPFGLVVHHLRSSLPSRRGPAKWLERLAEKWFIRNASFIITISRSTRQSVIDLSFGSEANAPPIAIVAPGIATRAPADASMCRVTSGPPFRMICVGNCDDPRKGLEYLIEALSLLPAAQFELLFAGAYSADSTYHRGLRHLIHRSGVSGAVSFVGRVSDEELAHLYQTADLFVFPSLWEGYGIAVAEALSHGLPVVATRVGAIPELVREGVNGLLVAPRDSRALASAVRSLAKDVSAREVIRANNLAFARDSFRTWEEVGERLSDIVEESLSRVRP